MRPIENVKHTVTFIHIDTDVIAFTTHLPMVVRHMVGEKVMIDGALYEIADSSVTYDTESVETGGMYSESVTVAHVRTTYYLNDL